ncbi:programmed cell death protein [Desmophyllum pertusum]|uniref:Programmed cell death protein n=1 Tax=Desmophyllum pertusum TaxID=174260 RepID=A0A9W9YSL4_9CNID|nr:programmed cell death protein [Desmophyllum pertusum]
MADEPLLLGLADGNMEENDDRICGWSTNKIGGTPNWLFGQPSDYPSCPLCGNVLYLVCQIYCPLSDSVFHRVLYIFGCVNTSCWNRNKGWKVLRSQAKDSNFFSKKKAENETSNVFEVDDWCDDAEDWGDDNDVSSTLQQCTGKLKLSEDKPDVEDTAGVQDFTMNCQNNETSASCVPHFAPLYISVFEAPDARGISAQPTEHERTLFM